MKKKFSLLYLLTILLLASVSIGWNFVDEICGSSSKDPADFFSKASPRALKLVEKAWQDYPDQTVYDLHVHAFGNNEKENGNYINPESVKIAHVTHYLRLKAYLIEIPMKPAGDSGGSQQVIPVEESTLLHTEN